MNLEIDVDIGMIRSLGTKERGYSRELAKISIVHEGNVNILGGRLIYEFTFYKDYEIVELLIHYGADIHTCDDKALMNIIRYNHYGEHYNIIELLLASGANVYAQENMPMRYSNMDNDNILRNLLKQYGWNREEALSLGFRY